MPTMVAAISVLDSKSPRRLERPLVSSAAGMRVFATGSFGSAGTVGATQRGSDAGGRAGRTTAPGTMSGEAKPAALTTTPVASPPPPAAERATKISPADTIVFQVCVADEAAERAEEVPAEEPLIVPVEADVKPVKAKRGRPLILATAGAGITLAGAMLVGGWISSAGSTPEPVSLSGGRAAPQEAAAPLDEPGKQADTVATEGQFSGILPIAETKQAAPQTTAPKATAPAPPSHKATTQQAAPKQPAAPKYPVPRYEIPRYDRDWTEYERDYDYGHDYEWDRGGRGDRDGGRHR